MLKHIPSWIAWRLAPQPGRTKPAKLPLNPRTGRPASVTDPRTWVGFDGAMGFSLHCGLAGVGFVLSPVAGIAAVDLDNVRDPLSGELDPLARTVVNDLDSFTEVSPSGRGLHVFALGRLDPRGRKRAGSIELYDRSRFIAMTGITVPGARSTLEDRGDVLRQLQLTLAPPVPPRGIQPAIGLGFHGDDHELLARAFAASNGARIRAYWNGDLRGKPSASEALLGLAQLLAFWTGPYPDRLEGLLTRSPLFVAAEAERRKWSSSRRGGTWGQQYIVARAIDTCPTFYAGSGLQASPLATEERSNPGKRESGESPPTCVSSYCVTPPGTSDDTPELTRPILVMTTAANAARGAAYDRILAAARAKGADSPTGAFHLSSRTAGLVAGVSHVTAYWQLRRLVAVGHLRLVARGKAGRQKRLASVYRISKPSDSQHRGTP